MNTQPGRGTPRDWEQMGGGFRDGQPRSPSRMPTRKDFGDAWEFNHEEVFFGGKGAEAHLQVKGEQPEWGPNWDEDQGGGEYPNAYYFYLPRICNHCTHPACLEACPRKAIEKREEDGIVLINEDRCRGYRFCMEACPYKKIYFNHVAEGLAEVHLLLPAHRAGRGAPRARGSARAACASSAIATTRTARSTSSSTSGRWRCRCTRSTAPSRTSSTCRRSRRRASTRTARSTRSKPRIPNEYLVSLFGPTRARSAGDAEGGDGEDARRARSPS